MNQLLRSKLETYKLHRTLITDILRELSDEQLGLMVANGVGSLGKQFKHVGRIQLCYVEALRTRRMSFFKRIGDDKLEKSRDKLLQFLE